MKKKIIMRALLGAPIGLAISTIISSAISYARGGGSYRAIVPELAADCGSELSAVTLQALCSLLYGAAFAGASVIWEREEWSLTKMTLTHLLVCSLATFPIAYCMYWMEHSVSGVLLYFGVFLMIYAAIWLGQYSSIKRKLDAINRKMSEKNF